jgi:hypothetical protein
MEVEQLDHFLQHWKNGKVVQSLYKVALHSSVY